MTVISPAALAPATRSAARLNSAAAPVCTILMPSALLARGAYVIAPLFSWLLSQLLEFGPIPDLCGAANGASELLELIAVVDEENSGRDQERASALHGQR